MEDLAQDLLIGAHVSAAGGPYKAVLAAQEIGATTLQLFTANQKRWDAKPLSLTAISLWKEALAQAKIQSVMSHASYLINLGAPNLQTLEKGRTAFLAEIERCHALEIDYLNFHPGAALKDDPQVCLDRIVESLISFERAAALGNTRLLLETTAGQGSCQGWRFEQLAYILSKVKGRLPIGVCIDTCHIFAAGYDIRTKSAWEKTLEEFDRLVGLENLYAFHVNDSLKDLGSRVDRHSPLGQGAIGIESFHFLMQDKRTRKLPKYLETPDPKLWQKEIQQLRQLAE